MSFWSTRPSPFASAPQVAAPPCSAFVTSAGRSAAVTRPSQLPSPGFAVGGDAVDVASGVGLDVGEFEPVGTTVSAAVTGGMTVAVLVGTLVAVVVAVCDALDGGDVTVADAV